MKKPKSQTEAIKRALSKGVRLSNLNCFRMVGTMKISTRVSELIRKNWVIKKEWKTDKTRFGTTCRYMEYTLDTRKTKKKVYGEYLLSK